MPEGPEIRRAADKIAAVLVDQRIQDITFGLPHLERFTSLLRGHKVIKLETRGKALLTYFDNGLAIYSHNQLYGRWWVMKRDHFPATNRSLRLALHTQTHSALLYSASNIEVLDFDEIGRHPLLVRLGPDILEPELRWRDIANRLLTREFINRGLASLYLDQSFLAGIGNYLRSEILFASGVNPHAKPSVLERKSLNALARCTLTISQRAYTTGGVTNPPRRVSSLKKYGHMRSDYRHAVFGRNGKPCYVCGQSIRKEVIAGRRLYWCPLCQS